MSNKIRSFCATHLVECLNKINVFPETYEKSHYFDYSDSTQGIKYTTTSSFHSKFDVPGQWWMVDMKYPVSIQKYRLKTNLHCNDVKNHSFLISSDNLTFKEVYSYKGFPGDQIFTLRRTYIARFVKIEGNTPDCTNEVYNYENILAFNYLELFGFIGQQQLTCKRIYSGLRMQHLSFVIIVLLK